MSRTPAEQATGAMRFALAFAQDQRVAQLSEKQLDRLRYAILKFCMMAAANVGLLGVPDMRSMGPTKLRRLQRDVGDVFHEIVQARDQRSPRLVPGAVAALSQRIGARGSLPIRLNVGLLQQLGKSSDVCVSYSGAAADVFLHVLFFVLLHGSRERILQCPCGKLFYRVGRRKCCRRECTNKSCWQRYSKTRKGRRAITKARKKFYQEKGWRYGARKKNLGSR